MINIDKPQRMCISCRDTFSKKTLLRMQCINKVITKFTGGGRSFYVCKTCSEDINRVTKSLYRQCKNKADYEQQLKEMVKIWKTK